MNFKMTVPQMQLEIPQYSFGPFSLLFLCLLSLILSSQAIRLDINVYDYSGVKRKVKLICERFEGNPRSESGEKETTYQSSHINIPDILSNSSQYFKCFFLEPIIIADHKQLKKRLARELSDSADGVPVEKGTCSPGYRIKGDLCFPCLPGSYTSGQQSECILCPKNFFIDFKAAPSCWPCPEGKITVGEGSDSPDFCIPPRKSLGTPSSDSTSNYIVIVSVILVLILIGWFIILYWFLFYRNRHRKKPEPTYKDLGIIEQGTARRRDSDTDECVYSNGYVSPDHIEEHIYEDSEEHIYEDIDEYQKSKVNNKPPNTKQENTRNINQTPQGYYNNPASKNTPGNKGAPYNNVKKTTYSDYYEVPISKNKEKIAPYSTVNKPAMQKPTYSDYYEVPTSKSKDNNAPYSTVNKPTLQQPIYSNDTYEVPMSKSKDNNSPYSTVNKPTYSNDTYEDPISKSKDNTVMRVQIVGDSPFKGHIDGRSEKARSKHKLIEKSINDIQTSRVNKSLYKYTEEPKQSMRLQNKSKKPHKPQEHLGGDGPSIEILPVEVVKARPSKSTNRVIKISEQDSFKVSNQVVENNSNTSRLKTGQADQERSQPLKGARFAAKEAERGGKNRPSSQKKDSDIHLDAERLSLLNENISKILEEDPIKAIRVSRSDGVLKKHRTRAAGPQTRKFQSEIKSNKFLTTERSNTKNSRIEQ